MSLTVVLVGDSTRLSYQSYAAVRLRSTAVWGPVQNCRSSRHLLAHLDDYVLDRLHERSLIHLNAGAHDITREFSRGFGVTVEAAEYHANMAAIADILSRHPLVARIVLATTTPVSDRRQPEGAESQRRNADVIAYNQALVQLATSAGYLVNDLYTAVKAAPFDPISADGVHLNELGKEHVGGVVARFVEPLVHA